MNLREYYTDSDFKYTLLSFALFGVLTIFALAIPNSLLSLYSIMLFALAFLTVLLVVDSVAYMPFAVTHSVFANGFAIPISVIGARMAFSGSFAVPNTLLLLVLGIWWLSILIHFITSESRMFSYLGSIERQMGMLYRLAIPVILFVSWQALHTLGYPFIFAILIVGALMEVLVLTLQFLDDEKYIKYHFSYMKNIGVRRYTGTISNPIPVANFLLTILPLAFAFYNVHDLIFFIVAYLGISWGLFLSHGRGSYIATVIISLLEIIYIAVIPQPIYMVLIALAVVVLPPITYLFTKQGKSNRERFISLFKFAKKVTFAKDSEESVESSAVNRVFLWREAFKAFEAHPFKGYGISNIARALRSIFSRKSSRYFITQVVDRCHNYYLDLLVEGGITHLLIYLVLISVAIYSSLISGMPFIAIAVIGFSIDVLFSFPLQINYLALMIIISIAFGIHTITFAPLGYVLLALSAIYVMNLYLSLRNNTAMRYLQLAFSVDNVGNGRLSIDSFMSALQTAPFEQRYFTVTSNYIEGFAANGKIQLSDLDAYLFWFENSKDFVAKVSEAPDVPFATAGALYAVAYSSTKDPKYQDEAWYLIKESLKMAPSSLVARRALFMILNISAQVDLSFNDSKKWRMELKQAEAVLRGIIDDFLGAPYKDYAVENSFWLTYFNVLEQLRMHSKKAQYYDKFIQRFGDKNGKKV